MKTRTIKQFEEWATTHKPLAANVCKAKAFAVTKRAQVDAYIKPIFDKYEFYTDLENTRERITDPALLYLSDDEEQCNRYYAECDAEHRTHGFNGPDGTCPALIAEHDLIKAENALLKAAAELFDMECPVMSLDNRTKMLDILHRFLTR